MTSRFRRRNERGAEAVEFALIAVPFLLVILGIIQYGFYFWTAETTNSSAREAARRIVVGDCWDATQLTNFAKRNAPMTTSASATWQHPNESQRVVGDTVTVTVNASANLLGMIPVPNGGDITREYVARLETNQSSGVCP